MARPLRIDVEDGWYHTMSRGIERREIFCESRYYEHFLELLEQMAERYAVEVHAYALLGNHYHLLVRTPQANASAALQWLNVSYSAWFNAKRERVGHVFQGRFRSTLIEGGGSWLLAASAYLHLNPVRVSALGLGKGENRAESLGLVEAAKESVAQRLRVLRSYPWSSYRACAGYTAAPRWLHVEELRGRAGGAAGYRRFVQGYVTRGLDPAEFDSLRERVVVGGVAFVERAKGWVRSVSVEQPDRRRVARRVGFDRVVRTVEAAKGQRWEQFASRRGDWGRALVLYLARKRCGLTLAELGEKAGGLPYKTVGKAVERFAHRLQADRTLARIERECSKQLSHVET